MFKILKPPLVEFWDFGGLDETIQIFKSNWKCEKYFYTGIDAGDSETQKNLKC